MLLQVFVLVFSLLAISNVEAAGNYDFGDFLATVLGVGIAVVGILACLGKYARQRARNEFI